MRGIGKKDALACRVSLGLFAGLLGIASTAHGAPVHDGGGTNHDGVRAGSASITASGATTNITSTTANNVIGWKDFSVKSGETVKFDNGANTNNYLNIVTGNVTSRIDGMMQGGKNVYVANPQGVRCHRRIGRERRDRPRHSVELRCHGQCDQCGRGKLGRLGAGRHRQPCRRQRLGQGDEDRP